MKKICINLFVVFLLSLLFNGSEAVVAAVPPQQTNLLTNPGFENPYNNDGAATGWVRWHRESSQDKFDDCTNGYHKRPSWGNATDFVHSGSVSQYIGNNWDTWAAGVWQTVNVTPGTRYRFSFIARGRGSNQGSGPSEGGLNMNVRAGIDPNGSGLWSDGDVVWGASGSPHDQWLEFSVEATATGDKVTVFTAADWGIPGVNQCRQFLSTYFDTAQLIEIAPPPTATSPPPPTLPPATATSIPPTATFTPEIPPTNTPTPTTMPTATATPLVGGTICVNAFADDNGNGHHEDNEGYMAGVTFTVASLEQVMGQAISPGQSDPICFEGLPAGNYLIEQIVPSRLEMTTAPTASIEVKEGEKYGFEFGSRLRVEISSAELSNPDSEATNEDVSNPEGTLTPEDDSFDLGLYIGLSAFGLAVILLGIMIFAFLRRQTV